MKITDLGQIVATRTLTLDGKATVTVRIGTPFMPPDYGGNFCCPYQILGLGSGNIRYAPGSDSVQALYLALEKIGTDLYASDEGMAGKILWEGSRDLGFPLPESIRDLRQK